MTKENMNYLSAEERYRRDPLFARLVDVMTIHIRDLQLTPTEMREAAMLASIKFEAMNPRPMIFSHFERRAGEIQLSDLPEHLK